MTPTTDAERYALAAKLAGCPEDQVRNFFAAGIVLQPHQLAASAAARLCDHRGGPTRIGYGGARGGGKSFWGIAQVVCDDCTRFPGLKFLYLRKVGKSGKEAVNDLRRLVLHSTPHEYKSGENVIVLPNDSRVILGHFQCEKDIDNYLGLEYDGALIEEATQLTSRKVSDVRTCVRSSKPGWRPRTYYTTNPGNVGHTWFKDAFIKPMRLGTETGTRFIQATAHDNIFNNEDYEQTLRETLVGWQRKAWIDGDWDVAAGQFFTTWNRHSHVVPPGAIPRDWRVWLGLDYGFTHYTAVYLFAQDGDGNVYVVAEHAERHWHVERHARAIRQMLDRHGIGLNRLEIIVAGSDVFAKKQNGGTIADDYAEEGFRLSAANMDRINGAAEVLARLGDGDSDPIIRPSVFISELCPRLIECLPTLEHDPHRPEDVLKVDADENGLGGDDAYDAFRYGLMHAPRRTKIVGRATPPRVSTAGYRAM